MARTWWSIASDTGRESAFTRLRHVLTKLDPYSGWCLTACGRNGREPASERTDIDLLNARELDGIEPNICPRCDALTKEEVQ